MEIVPALLRIWDWGLRIGDCGIEDGGFDCRLQIARLQIADCPIADCPIADCGIADCGIEVCMPMAGVPTMSPEILKTRLEQFALDVFALTAPLLRDLESRDVALQLRRAASSTFANYGSACVARSHAEFTAKIGIAFEEADESRRWLRFLKNAGLSTSESLDGLINEAMELRSILGASHLTAKRNRTPRPKR